MNALPFLFAIAAVFWTSAAEDKYEPNWASLDKRPLPQWYDEAKFGIFIHWGVFSVPSFGSEWFWYYWKGDKVSAYVDFMKKNYPPGFTYPDFAPMFTAEFYNPYEWADIFKAAGAKYIVLTSKHHEGFTNWPSKVSWNWNSMDVGPHRDLTGELAAAIRNKTDIHFGLYHSLFEWFNPIYNQDKANHFKSQDYVKTKTMPELYEIVNAYKPEVIWSDGDGRAPAEYWNSTEFIAWLYNDSPVKDRVVVNDRWGEGVMCKHGDVYTCQDRYVPGHLIKHKWESCMTIDKGSWGYRRNTQLSDYVASKDLIHLLIEIVSCGGNLLLNVGPTHDGRIVPLFEERLRDIGSWLRVNGEAIYSTVPWTYQKDNSTKTVWYTSSKSGNKAVYAHMLDWPAGNALTLASVTPTQKLTVTMLGHAGKLKWNKSPKGGVMVQLPVLVSSQLPCKWAWVLKLENL